MLRALLRPQLEAHREIEVPYFSTLEFLSDYLDFSTLQAQHLFQCYIPETNLDAVFRRLGTSSEVLGSLDASMWARARLRRVIEVVPSGASHSRYFLQLKTSRGDGVSRTECGVELTESRFAKLLPLATAGAVEKLRYLVPGFIRGTRGKQHPAEAHIDVLLAAGQKIRALQPTRVSFSPVPFVFIDIELPSEQLVPSLSEINRHSFGFLEAAVSVREEPRWIRRCTSTRRLAAFGFKEESFREAVQALRERLKRKMRGGTSDRSA